MNIGRTLRRSGSSLAFGLACVASSCFAQVDVMDQIRDRRYVVIAHRESSFPFSYVDGEGKVRGYAIDICLKIVDAVRKELNLKELTVQHLLVTPATRLNAIASGKADLECGSTTNTSERRKLVDFTIPHFISSARLLVRADRKYNDIGDLRGKRIVSTKGTTNIATLKRISGERNLNISVAEVNDHAEGFRAVESGDAEGFAMDDVLLFGMRARARSPNAFEIVGKSMSLEPYAIMLPKNQSRFKKVVDATLRRVILDREIDPLYRKWFESPIPPDGINLGLKMPYVLRDSFRAPSSKVHDWYLD
jgi:ABC-type amino acid transport substrate-binding protein